MERYMKNLELEEKTKEFCALGTVIEDLDSLICYLENVVEKKKLYHLKDKIDKDTKFYENVKNDLEKELQELNDIIEILEKELYEEEENEK